MSHQVLKAIRKYIILLLLLFSGCNSDEEGFHPDIMDLVTTPNPVVAGEISTISFWVSPRSSNNIFIWNATIFQENAAGGFLDISEGRTGPNQRVTIHFHSKNPTIEEDASVIFSIYDPALPSSSSNKGRLYTVYIKVIPRPQLN